MAASKFYGVSKTYKGKVRNVYYIENELIILESSDRISAFDVILPKPIPHKGQVLNQIAGFMLQKSNHICPNWLLKETAGNISVGYACEPIKIEMVVRGYLSGHAWRTYQTGARVLCGASLAEGLKENDALPQPIITPSTKATEGHDEDITPEEIVAKGLATAEQWKQLCNAALALFKFGQDWANKQGLILVDTKYEFGYHKGKLYVMDEIHTPDSSRYFYADTYAANQANGIKQKQLSKEFVREWLIAHDFMGQEGQQVPEMTSEILEEISNRYILLYEKLTGEKFIADTSSEEEKIVATNNFIKSLM
jgi:phosphoribosylaminoimidazole-succinocarboxamide synthase